MRTLLIRSAILGGAPDRIGPDVRRAHLVALLLRQIFQVSRPAMSRFERGEQPIEIDLLLQVDCPAIVID